MASHPERLPGCPCRGTSTGHSTRRCARQWWRLSLCRSCCLHAARRRLGRLLHTLLPAVLGVWPATAPSAFLLLIRATTPENHHNPATCVLTTQQQHFVGRPRVDQVGNLQLIRVVDAKVPDRCYLQDGQPCSVCRKMARAADALSPSRGTADPSCCCTCCCCTCCCCCAAASMPTLSARQHPAEAMMSVRANSTGPQAMPRLGFGREQRNSRCLRNGGRNGGRSCTRTL